MSSDISGSSSLAICWTYLSNVADIMCGRDDGFCPPHRRARASADAWGLTACAAHYGGKIGEFFLARKGEKGRPPPLARRTGGKTTTKWMRNPAARRRVIVAS